MPTQRFTHRHRSFLLRCWQEQTGDKESDRVWRFAIREVAEKPQEQAFSSPGKLLDFLLEKLREDAAGRAAAPPTDPE